MNQILRQKFVDLYGVPILENVSIIITPQIITSMTDF